MIWRSEVIWDADLGRRSGTLIWQLSWHAGLRVYVGSDWSVGFRMMRGDALACGVLSIHM